MGTQLARALPAPPARDVAQAIALYRDSLGFAVAFETGDYAGVARGPVELHLDGSQGGAGPVSARIDVVGIDALHGQVPAGAMKPDEPLETKPWGLRQFSVVDPHGNRITFAERVG